MSTDIKADAAARHPAGAPEAGYAWLRDGNMPHTREDVIAEVVALVALLFSLGVGLLIATLPVSANAAATQGAASAPSLEAAASPAFLPVRPASAQ